ncbi:MAG: amino acid ABC transporter permease [Gracilibacteraceae bacterium]|jgi:L-cystine transport system permease protein|nr:amino acid ABC transporter permease [Gracilibacteraceae bacterium]
MFRYRPEVAWVYLFKLLPYLKVTLFYMAGALAIGIVFGAGLAMMKLGKNRPLRYFAVGYTAVMRSLPPIILIFLIYHGVPLLARRLWQVNISGLDTVYFVILALGLSSVATLSEIMKSAYLSVSGGQYEAAVSNGFTPFQAFRRIMFPQALRVSIPNLGNALVILMKEGSLGYTVGLIDIMGRANLLNSTAYGNDIYEIFFTLAAIYWLASVLIDRSFRFLENKLSLERRIRLKEAGLIAANPQGGITREP